MGLIDAADGEGFHDPLMRPLAGLRIGVIKRAFMLVDHDTVFFQSLIAVTVKFPGKQSLPRSEGIGGVHNNQIVLILTGADKFQAVFVVDGEPLVIQAAGCLRQIFLHICISKR